MRELSILRLKFSTVTNTRGSIDSLRDEIKRWRKEQPETMKLVTQIISRFEKFEARVTALEDGAPASTPAKEEKTAQEAAEDADEDDSDVGLFQSDDEEDDAETEGIAAYKEKQETSICRKNKFR